MTKEYNKRIVRRFNKKLWNKKDLDIIDELIADDYADRTAPPEFFEDELKGPDRLKEVVTRIQKEFLDIHVYIKDQIAEDDQVVTCMTWECTLNNKDDPANPLIFTLQSIGIDHIENGRIVENWNTLDALYRLINLLKLQDPFIDPDTPFPDGTCNRDADCGGDKRFRCWLGRCQRISA
ncbi:hypothetical protein KSF_002140 [Reticulibacter mediterranei]|uniref:Ester cyclase n=1 Tax=Reticulibacter mediterranei TaxID=2778369 RepID=A0A8J3IH41_9CHLR|nr:ester cyclase [Reticulibacter mediterranei]GHO90166.1 hypothetical protein KSF_002140 [Reticulibacter mediterranei]